MTAAAQPTRVSPKTSFLPQKTSLWSCGVVTSISGFTCWAGKKPVPVQYLMNHAIELNASYLSMTMHQFKLLSICSEGEIGFFPGLFFVIKKS